MERIVAKYTEHCDGFHYRMCFDYIEYLDRTIVENDITVSTILKDIYEMNRHEVSLFAIVMGLLFCVRSVLFKRIYPLYKKSSSLISFIKQSFFKGLVKSCITLHIQ